mmetsp:Transcript_64863/g.155035  ORF Transcript_64863/g.155035 Transcript_64863/m.155035 type:complete len:257 (+) Transcript_64863:257-1027(+)
MRSAVDAPSVAPVWPSTVASPCSRFEARGGLKYSNRNSASTLGSGPTRLMRHVNTPALANAGIESVSVISEMGTPSCLFGVTSSTSTVVSEVPSTITTLTSSFAGMGSKPYALTVTTVPPSTDPSTGDTLLGGATYANANPPVSTSALSPSATARTVKVSSPLTPRAGATTWMESIPAVSVMLEGVTSTGVAPRVKRTRVERRSASALHVPVHPARGKFLRKIVTVCSVAAASAASATTFCHLGEKPSTSGLPDAT